MKSGLLGGLGPGKGQTEVLYQIDMFWHFWGPVTLGGGQGNCPFYCTYPLPPLLGGPTVHNKMKKWPDQNRLNQVCMRSTVDLIIMVLSV